jgi:hypothetical protein
MSRYAKALVALIPGLIVLLKVLSDAIGDGVVDPQEYIALAVAALSAVGVYAVPNRAPAGEAPDPTKSEVGP